MPTTSTDQTAKALASVPLFGALSESERKALASRAIPRNFAAEEILFLEGEPCQGLYVVAGGSVKIYKSSSSGREILLAIERAPSSIAEIPVFDGGSYPASTVAIEPVTAYFINKEDFQQLCRQHPEIALKLLRVVGRRLRTLVSLLHQVSFGSVRQRVARSLLDFEQRAGGSPFTLPVTHHELALRLGTVREVITRNLRRFQSQGFIRTKGREIWISDSAGLQEEAETEVS